ncbi:2'-5' RNA ligase family protein [Actinoplanes teichomyceticus]|uniref:2'-5' RNA ligase superfamily protein n=1 Tax=Actinoplanes teichomyceticus TaxID=1867 RepID=A0A561VKU8_ACTTI|nr:2'-5' RNA ligase family protein [Actinoplanes teichomyceticus]TWG12249.1 hypothetical protein FHX34_105116 [Actinoplanes teichomyceticus]GIF14186.1 hypothetical protein Ate01nite_42180 [Actinoplanes teichomyceticus]
MHTVELLLNRTADERVRDQWRRLHAAGLPSLATHPHPSNRPHLTVLKASSVAGLAPVPLPLPATLGPVRMLGRALVREVTATPELRALHRSLWSTLPDPWPPPEDWVPHVSLALRFPAASCPAAVEVLAASPPVHGSFVAARSYDIVARTLSDIPTG